ncbi:hypothetical protein OPV22_009388 [Ensete ventricosum]|uniref:Uncharacterized protein n=1 Tax=Ensete ventricosum TaxID=4639 RepID=A0AAV8RIC3_ENSVE|nr:hypothetical protein OPV22_009388 [Ensete ventricosum]
MSGATKQFSFIGGNAIPLLNMPKNVYTRGARQRPRRLRAARTAGGWGGVGELPHQGACSSQKEAETWGRGSPAALGEVGTQQPSAMRAGCRRGKIIPPPASRRTTPRQSLHCRRSECPLPLPLRLPTPSHYRSYGTR